MQREHPLKVLSNFQTAKSCAYRWEGLIIGGKLEFKIGLKLKSSLN